MKTLASCAVAQYKKSLLSVLAMAAISAPVFAGEPINKTLDADPSGIVNIEIVRGDIKIEGWDKSTVEVVGTMDDKTKEFIFKRDGKTIYIENKIEKNSGRGEGAKLTIRVPKQSAVDADLVSADLSAKKINGKAELSTVSGDLTAEDLGQEVKLTTVSGDIRLVGAGKNVEMTSVSGDIHAELSAERLSATSVSGDVKIDNKASLSRVSVESVSGDVGITSAFNDGVELDAETVSGDVVITAIGSVNAKLKIETGPGGDITNRLSDAKPNVSFISSQELNTTIGSGRGSIKVETVSGDIVLQKK